jgi:hypothetical protein
MIVITSAFEISHIHLGIFTNDALVINICSSFTILVIYSHSQIINVIYSKYQVFIDFIK